MSKYCVGVDPCRRLIEHEAHPRPTWKPLGLFLAFWVALIGGVLLYTHSVKADVEYPEVWPISCTLFVTVPPTEARRDFLHWEERYPSKSVNDGMTRGKSRAAAIWGLFPGATFGLFCLNITEDNPAVEKDREARSPDGPGHGGLHWRMAP